jgi:hypothetical protein
LFLRVNYPTVRSVVAWVELRCCNAGCGDNFRRTITLDLYAQANAICYIGSVMYGHIVNPLVANGQTYNLTSSSLQIGTVPAGACGGCYTGPHSHMERLGGVSLAPCCCTAVTSSTNIYKWDFNPSSCPSAPQR